MSSPENKPRKRRAGPRQYTKGAHRFRERDGTWYAYLPGKPPRRISLGTRDESEAEIALRRLCGDSDGVARIVGGPRIVDLAREWLAAPHGWTTRTLGTTKNRIKAAGIALALRGIHYPEDITAAALDAWITERRHHVSHRTINRDLRALRTCLEWAAQRGECSPVEALDNRKDLREAKRTSRAVLPDPSEVALVVAELALHDRGGDRRRADGRISSVCVRALYASGLRCDELRRLSVYDLRKGLLWVRPEGGAASKSESGKSWRERTIPLDPTGEAVLRAYLKAVDGRPRAWSHSWLLHRLHAACAVAGVPQFGLHDLRRAAATEWHRAGIAIGVIAQWLGHAETQTTELYLGAYRSDRSIVAPAPRGLLSIPRDEKGTLRSPRNLAVSSGQNVAGNRQTQPSPESETPTIPAPSGRVELPANGLGNRCETRTAAEKTRRKK